MLDAVDLFAQSVQAEIIPFGIQERLEGQDKNIWTRPLKIHDRPVGIGGYGDSVEFPGQQVPDQFGIRDTG